MSRVIFLVDMNSFFISCEATRHPEIVGKPAAVAGNPKTRTGIILTANYEARKFGVKTTMLVHEALKLCPNMQLLPPDHSFYVQKSQEVMDILYSYTPAAEQNSIDEAWLDMTGCEGIFGKPTESAKQIMDKLKGELGLCCSIGISENKFLSKMASEMKKPLGITELWKKDINIKLWPLPVQSMYGVGKQTTQKLNSMGIITIRDLALYNKEILTKKLGKAGMELNQLANGIDFSSVMWQTHADIKSIGRSVTLSEDISDIDSAKLVLMKLTDEVTSTARKSGKKGRTVQINIKYSNFKSITRQITVPETYQTNEIYSVGVDLLKKNWDNKLPVRLLGISLSGFAEDSAATQLSLFDIPEANLQSGSSEKLDRLDSAIDSIREKYGSSVIKRAVLMKKKEKE